MKSVKHVLNTWLAAIHIFPTAMLFYDAASSGRAALALLLPIALFGALFSLASLVFCSLLITPIVKAVASANASLDLWMLSVAISIALSSGVICYALFGSFITWQELPFVGCAVSAALIAILLRLQFFFQIATFQTKTYEKDLV